MLTSKKIINFSLSFLLILFVYTGCKKDDEVFLSPSSKIENRELISPISIEDAKVSFRTLQNIENPSYDSLETISNFVLTTFQPIWSRASTNGQVLSVPVLPPNNFTFESNQGVKLLCYRDNNNEIQFRLWLLFNLESELLNIDQTQFTNNLYSIKIGIFINEFGYASNSLHIFHNDIYSGYYSIENFEFLNNELEMRGGFSDRLTLFDGNSDVGKGENPCDYILFARRWIKNLHRWVAKNLGVFTDCYPDLTTNDETDKTDENGRDNKAEFEKWSTERTGWNSLHSDPCTDFDDSPSNGGSSNEGVIKCNPFSNLNVQDNLANCAKEFDNDILEIGIKILLEDSEEANEAPAGIVLAQYGSGWNNYMASALYLFLYDYSINSITEALLLVDQNPTKHLGNHFFYNLPKTEFAETIQNCLNVHFDILINEYTEEPCGSETASTGDEIFEADCENTMTLGEFIDNISNCPIVSDYITCSKAGRSFAATYGLDLSQEEIHLISDSGADCTNPLEFDEIAFEKLTEHYSSQTTNTYPTPENSGFFDRTLSCESFVFTDQPVASGQIACVKGLYLSKNYGPAHYNAPDFCGHFTVPRIRYNGEVISAGKAANCSAWAANASGAVAGIAFSKNVNITDEGLKIVFKKSYNIKMKLTSCGYGAMTECEDAECLGSEQQVIWNNGFFDWLGEQFFNCD